MSPSDLPSPWDKFAYLSLAGLLFSMISRIAKKGFVNWSIHLGPACEGPRIGERRFTRSESPKIFGTTIFLFALAISYCITSAIPGEVKGWISIISLLSISLLVTIMLNKSSSKESPTRPPKP
ncbi:MAG: hypothetical protein ACQKBT_08330 [Puniceicoccales bacterium]